MKSKLCYKYTLFNVYMTDFNWLKYDLKYLLKHYVHIGPNIDVDDGIVLNYCDVH